MSRFFGRPEGEESAWPPARPRSKWGRTLGILLIVLSFLAYGVLISLPVLPLEGKLKLVLAPVLVGVGEATFWIGGLFVGRELVTRYRRYLNPCHWVCRSTRQA